MHDIDLQLKKIIRKQLHEFPFHNLALLLNKPVQNGGTCFDHALHLKAQLTGLGFDACLHEAFACITGELCHRIVKVNISGECYFLDTGSGLPTAYVIRTIASAPIQHHSIAGVKFKIITNTDNILIKRQSDKGWLDMNKIPLTVQDEPTILTKFSDRYRQELPFKNELRICWLDGDIFFRIEGLQLSIFSPNKAPLITPVNKDGIQHIVATNFPELEPALAQYLEGIN